VTRIIVTHYHPDHVGTAAWLIQHWGAEFWMTEAEFLTAHAVREGLVPFSLQSSQQHFRRHGLDGVRLKAQETRGNAYRIGVPTLPSTYRRLMDGDEMAIGERIWRIRTAFGHAPEHATLYCEELNLLISGDQILPRITTNVGVWGNQPDGDPLKLFLDSLDRFLPLPADTVVLPSHGQVFIGLHARISQLRDHHVARLAELEAAMDAPRCAAELLPVLFPRPLDDHQLMFAMGEIVAHLNHLAFAGRAQREISPDGSIRFVRAH
jgi:glyoxylase-like metal-dependent hydrolase (beta-lactamase superfamily II)